MTLYEGAHATIHACPGDNNLLIRRERIRTKDSAQKSTKAHMQMDLVKTELVQSDHFVAVHSVRVVPDGPDHVVLETVMQRARGVELEDFLIHHPDMQGDLEFVRRVARSLFSALA